MISFNAVCLLGSLVATQSAVAVVKRQTATRHKIYCRDSPRPTNPEQKGVSWAVYNMTDAAWDQPAVGPPVISDSPTSPNRLSASYSLQYKTAKVTDVIDCLNACRDDMGGGEKRWV
jgi:hypothetical protein